MKIELEVSWRELTAIGIAVVLCVVAFVGGAYLGSQSINRAAVDLDRNAMNAAAESFKSTND